MPSYKILNFSSKNFRNIEFQNIEFSSKLNLIIGKNGNGKTNLLEGIHLLGSKKSFRKNNTFPQFLKVNGENSNIYILSIIKEESSDRKIPFNCQIDSNGFNFSFDGKIVKKIPLIITMYISPFDAHLFYLIPKVRRDFFDHYLGILNSEYKKILSKYFSLIKIRNKLISSSRAARSVKDIKGNFSNLTKQINAVDKELSRYIPIIIRERELFLSNLKTIYPQVAKDIFANDVDINIILDSKFKSLSEEEVFKFMQDNLNEDIKLGITKYSVHRDNYLISFNGLNCEGFASTGQQKLCYLSTLFAYIELFKNKFSIGPILLLDDVATELDKQKLNGLVKYLSNGNFQVFITTTDENFENMLFKETTLFNNTNACTSHQNLHFPIKKFKLEAGYMSLMTELV
ncbi:MAG: DNA replication/repair protein RecF [Oligoflexia bacterium]|nr:DNA replication/repair protein RecF [Oligoflexia bacterium]